MQRYYLFLFLQTFLRFFLTGKCRKTHFEPHAKLNLSTKHYITTHYATHAFLTSHPGILKF